MFSTTIPLDKFKFERFRAKVKVIVAIFRKNIVIPLVPLFIIQFQYNFTQVLGMTIPRTFWISACQGQGQDQDQGRSNCF